MPRAWTNSKRSRSNSNRSRSSRCSLGTWWQRSRRRGHRKVRRLVMPGSSVVGAWDLLLQEQQKGCRAGSTCQKGTCGAHKGSCHNGLPAAYSFYARAFYPFFRTWLRCCYAALDPSNRPAPAPAPVHLTKPQVATNALARLEGRMGAGGDTQVGFGGAALQGGAGTALPAPVRPGDSRKRIAPEPTGSGPAQVAEKAGSMPPPGPRAPAAAAVAPSGGAAPAAKRQRQTSPAAAAGGAVGAAAARATGGHQAVAAAQPTGAAAAGGAADMQPGVAVGAWGAVQLLQAPVVRQEWTVRFRGEEQQQAALCRDGEGGVPPPGSRELRIANRSVVTGLGRLLQSLAGSKVSSACPSPDRRSKVP